MGVNRGLGAAVRRGLAEAVAARRRRGRLLRRRRRVRPRGARGAGRADPGGRGRLRRRLALPRRHPAHAPDRGASATASSRWRCRPSRAGRSSDGQSGYRALSRGGRRRRRDRPRLQLRPGADARPARQGLPLRRGARSATPSASTAARSCGSLPYLRRVVPAVYREINAVAPPAARTLELSTRIPSGWR